jgi:hypothetical protein
MLMLNAEVDFWWWTYFSHHDAGVGETYIDKV